jgi:hypothetical protein
MMLIAAITLLKSGAAEICGGRSVSSPIVAIDNAAGLGRHAAPIPG